jgi:hypothetical protein
MINRDDAERIAGEMTGAPSDDLERGWELTEFSAGWYVIEYAKRGRRGGVSRVIERESGRVMRFPSFVPPDRIIEEYDQVLAEGRPDERWPASS